MTTRALKIAAMIQRLIRQAHVAEICRCPGVRDMAQAAVLRRVEMIRVLASRDGAVVTGGAGTYHLIVVNRRHRGPDCCVVAVFANVGCLYVRRPFAGRIRAIVATYAVVRNIRVIEVCR